MRNVGGRGQLPDIWVGMDTERALHRWADHLGWTVRDLIVSLLEVGFSEHMNTDDVELDFGE